MAAAAAPIEKTTRAGITLFTASWEVRSISPRLNYVLSAAIGSKFWCGPSAINGSQIRQLTLRFDASESRKAAAKEGRVEVEVRRWSGFVDAFLRLLPTQSALTAKKLKFAANLSIKTQFLHKFTLARFKFNKN